MPFFMIVLILYVNLLNLSLIKRNLFLKNMEPLKSSFFVTFLIFGNIFYRAITLTIL